MPGRHFNSLVVEVVFEFIHTKKHVWKVPFVFCVMVYSHRIHGTGIFIPRFDIPFG